MYFQVSGQGLEAGTCGNTMFRQVCGIQSSYCLSHVSGCSRQCNTLWNQRSAMGMKTWENGREETGPYKFMQSYATQETAHEYEH